MRHVYLCYANEAYSIAQACAVHAARKFGRFDQIIAAGPHDVDPSFAHTHREVLAQPRGGGYWLWKPHLIYRTLLSMTDGDLLTYADAGIFVMPGFIETHQRNLAALTGNSKSFTALRVFLRERKYTKRDAFIRLDCDHGDFADSDQFVATAMPLIIRNSSTLDFFRTWLRWCEFNVNGRYLIDDSPSILGNNFPDFVDHRHDQSLYSLLCKRHPSIVHEIPLTQFETERLHWFHTPNDKIDLFNLCGNNHASHPQSNAWIRFVKLPAKDNLLGLARGALKRCQATLRPK